MSASTAELRPGRVQSLRFDDMDAMASALVGDNVEFVPIQNGKFDGRFCRIELNGFDIRRVIHAPFLIHGVITSDRVVLNLRAPRAGDLTLNGDAFEPSMLAVMSEGSVVQANCPAEGDRIGLSFRAEAFDQLIEMCGVQAFPRGRHQMLPLREDEVGTLVRTFAAITDLADSLPNLFAVPDLDKALTEECYSLLAGVLSKMEKHPERPRQTRDILQHVRAADEFLRAHIERPIYTEEICVALGISTRMLHQSFAAVYDMSPHSYLKRRRLELVRRALRSPHDGRAMVKSIALSHGFWHLGHFGQEYAAMFGEMPSQTLGKSNPLR